jgi:lysozyme family protein
VAVVADSSWDKCLEFIFSVEGGFTDDPLDPGGATNLGITHDELALWRKQAVSIQDVKDLGKNEASAIYFANYWQVVQCGKLAPGVDLMVFDAAVNTGNSRSARFLQQAVGTTQDGLIGPITLASANKAGPISLINNLASIRLRFYQSLPTFIHFGNGWTSRVSQAQTVALGLIH